jgi:L-seryl-tRNA(Ser) seleniumtransferase
MADPNLLRSLPSVDRLAGHPALAGFSDRARRIGAREAVALFRSGTQAGLSPDLEALPEWAAKLAEEADGPSLKPAINMSGVVLHTGLGRARLAPEAAMRILEAAFDHSAVEIDLDTGARGDRQGHVRDLLCELTGAEDALVVNNCAASVHLALHALCAGREVVLSRGQMVEIGGAFRMPDIVRDSGCRLVEVGCTNKTRLSDYEGALTDETAAVLRCHPSNFRIIGFYSEPTATELARLCQERGVCLIDDVGSGCLVDTTRFGLPRERTLRDALADGADLVLASGDKLLGGPQAGLVLGREELVVRMAAHPTARAFRVDKLTLAGLESTLRLYAEGREAEVPVWRYAGRSLEEVKKLARTVARACPGWGAVEPGTTEMGGGSMPGRGLPTWRVGLSVDDPEAALRRLRSAPKPIIGYVERDRVWLDPRTVELDEAREVAAELRSWQ